MIATTTRPSDWHELNDEGNWFTTDQKTAEKHKFEIEEELKSKQRKYIKLREDIIFSSYAVFENLYFSIGKLSSVHIFCLYPYLDIAEMEEMHCFTMAG